MGSIPNVTSIMNKYYITCGDLRFITLAHTAAQSCFKMFANMPSVNKLSSDIRVSEKGHNIHSDDIVYNLAHMFCLWLLDINWSGNFAEPNE